MSCNCDWSSPSGMRGGAKDVDGLKVGLGGITGERFRGYGGRVLARRV